MWQRFRCKKEIVSFAQLYKSEMKITHQRSQVSTRKCSFIKENIVRMKTVSLSAVVAAIVVAAVYSFFFHFFSFLVSSISTFSFRAPVRLIALFLLLFVCLFSLELLYIQHQNVVPFAVAMCFFRRNSVSWTAQSKNKISESKNWPMNFPPSTFESRANDQRVECEHILSTFLSFFLSLFLFCAYAYIASESNCHNIRLAFRTPSSGVEFSI